MQGNEGTYSFCYRRYPFAVADELWWKANSGEGKVLLENPFMNLKSLSGIATGHEFYFANSPNALVTKL